MNEKISSAFDSLKDMASKAHLDEKINEAGDSIKKAISEIDIKETAGEVIDKVKESGFSEALHEVGDKIKDVAGKAVRESLRNNPGAAINSADDGKVNPTLVNERTCALNNNPRNSDM